MKEEKKDIDKKLNRLSVNLQIDNTPRHRRKRSIPKLTYIDHRKTLEYNSRNMALEEFSRSLVIPDPRAYNSSLCLLSNFFNILHIAVLQICIVSLPHSPTTLLIILTILEFMFIFTILIPYFCVVRFMRLVDFLSMILRSLFILGFFVTCLLISLSSGRVQRPVNSGLQKLESF